MAWRGSFVLERQVRVRVLNLEPGVSLCTLVSILACVSLCAVAFLLPLMGAATGLCRHGLAQPRLVAAMQKCCGYGLVPS